MTGEPPSSGCRPRLERDQQAAPRTCGVREALVGRVVGAIKERPATTARQARAVCRPLSLPGRAVDPYTSYLDRQSRTCGPVPVIRYRHHPALTLSQQVYPCRAITLSVRVRRVPRYGYQETMAHTPHPPQPSGPAPSHPVWLASSGRELRLSPLRSPLWLRDVLCRRSPCVSRGRGVVVSVRRDQ